MITTELYKGQGLGNQLACYVATRVIAIDQGYDFGIGHPEHFKGSDFLELNFGRPIVGGSGPEGGPPRILPNTIKYYYSERRLFHSLTGADITTYDKNLTTVADNTKIDGLMQDEQYIIHHKDDIRVWLKVKEKYECYDYADDNTCVINFRGGEYARHPEFFLKKSYWAHAVAHMLTINKNFRFIVITDDVFTAKKFFPQFDVFHFSIAKDYVVIKNAHYLILSNSSFAWFPAWLNQNLKFCIAPKYWARHNTSDGYWSLGYNITNNWHYLNREGVLFEYETCIAEIAAYEKVSPSVKKNQENYSSNIKPNNNAINLKKNIPTWIKTIAKSIINETKHVANIIRSPFDLIMAKKRAKKWLLNIEHAEYRKKIKIYDAFNFFNELEILDIRLHILDQFVDYFVIVESRLTHSGKPKELIYEKNKDRFKKFSHKIFHYVIERPLQDFTDAENRLLDPLTTEAEKIVLQNAITSDSIPDRDNNYLRDFYEKEMVKQALTAAGAQTNDFCYVSDLDEIWNPEALIDYSKKGIYKYKQDAYVYYLNNRSNEDWLGWCGTIATTYGTINSTCLNDLRTARKTRYSVIRDGGWHFTFQGGVARIKDKLASYSYHEINTENNQRNIENIVSQNKDIKGRYIRFWKDETKLPKYLLENKEKYKELFK